MFSLYLSDLDKFYSFFNFSYYFHCFFNAFLFKKFRIFMSNLAGFFVIPYVENISTISESESISISLFSFDSCFGFQPNLKMKFFIA